jgi:seipin
MRRRDRLSRLQQYKIPSHSPASAVYAHTDTNCPQNALLFPIRIATSPPLLRTYLRTILLLTASSILFAFAVIAYTSFYYSYVPIRGISVPVYLQFDHGTTPNAFPDSPSKLLTSGGKKWPHAIAGVQGLVTRQKYDVSVELTVPRSRLNLRAGNWMLDLSLRSHPSSVLATLLGWDDDEQDTEPLVSMPDGGANTPPPPLTASRPNVLAHSRRPAILTYRSWPTEHIHRALRLPFYLTGFGSESETLNVVMLEAASFAEMPTSLRLELRSTVPLEVYSARVHIRAKLEGLRWVMYRYRLLSASVFVLLFWATEMGLLVLTWGAASLVLGTSSDDGDGEQDSEDRKAGIKREAANEPGTPGSDTSHTFPTLSNQPPLRYSSPDSTKAKSEPPEPRLEDILLKEEAEADDEEDDFVLESPPLRTGSADVLFTDSGLGTGMDSERDRERVRRRGSGRGGRVKEEGGER